MQFSPAPARRAGRRARAYVRACRLAAIPLFVLSIGACRDAPTAPDPGPESGAPGGSSVGQPPGSTTGGDGTTTGNGATPGGAPEQPSAPSAGPSIEWHGFINAGEVGTQVLRPPYVVVRDAGGAPAAGVPVVFSVANGNGSITGAEQVTNDKGMASAYRWTLGPIAGVQTLIAATPGLAPIAHSVTARAGAPARLLVHEGDAQTAPVMTFVATRPGVRLTDRFGNAIVREWVTFVADGVNGAAAFDHIVQTDFDGVARVGGWRVGMRPGTYSLTATSLGFTATLSATATIGEPARLLLVEGDEQIAPRGSVLPIAPAVRLADGWGNHVERAGVKVVFEVRIGGGKATGMEALTDARGIARVGSWTLGPMAGGNVLAAESPGLVARLFRATAQ